MTARCAHCAQPGKPYEHRGQTFDGLFSCRGERVCRGCLDRQHRADVAELDAVTPAHIGDVR